MTPVGHDRIWIAFSPAAIAFCVAHQFQIVPAKAAFVIARLKSKLLDQMTHVILFCWFVRVCVEIMVRSSAFRRHRSGTA
jgi:hypothetical protein